MAFVNTSMHGVGDPFTSKAFEIAGFSPYTPVKEQQHADPEFPTVKFPNPEEKGNDYLLFCNYSSDDEACRRTRMLKFMCLGHRLTCFSGSSYSYGGR